jgi:hypothetical protein
MLFTKYEASLVNASDSYDFARILNNLVIETRGSHFGVFDPSGRHLDNYWDLDTRKENFNLSALPRIIGNYRDINPVISTGSVSNIGYILIKSWYHTNPTEEGWFNALSHLITEFRNSTDGLIIDVRPNGGGTDIPSNAFAAHFVRSAVHFGYVDFFQIPSWNRINNSPQVFPVDVSMLHYDKPVLLLIGNWSASTTESHFIPAMQFAPNVKTIGDRTAGFSGSSSGLRLDLSNGVQVTPTTKAFKDLDGVYLEGNGIEPNQYVQFINDGSDNVLIEAFRQLGVTVTDPGSNTAFNLAAKLDETGTVMTFTRSYLMDGVPFEHYGSPLASEHRNLMGSDWLMKIRFRKAGTTVAYRELVSESPIIVAPTYEQATFRLGSALEEGLYEIASYESGDDNDGVDLVLKTPGDWDDWYDNFVENSGLTESELKTIEDRFALFDDGNPQMSNTVLIEKEQSNNGGGTPTITTTSLPGGMVGTAYSQTLIANGTGPITWTLDGGNLPNDLKLNPDTGEISGIPTTAGTFNFTVKATNTEGNDTKPLSITIASNGGNSDDSSGGGGCNAVFGLFGLLPLAVWVARKRMAA